MVAERIRAHQEQSLAGLFEIGSVVRRNLLAYDE